MDFATSSLGKCSIQIISRMAAGFQDTSGGKRIDQPLAWMCMGVISDRCSKPHFHCDSMRVPAFAGQFGTVADGNSGSWTIFSP
jgi:hypothetical protein